MNARHMASVIAFLALLLPLCAFAHGIDLPAEEQEARAEESKTESAHADGDMEARIEDLLEAKLASIRAELAEIHAELEEPGLLEIVGGIGWIAGILGIAAYLKSRKGK